MRISAFLSASLCVHRVTSDELRRFLQITGAVKELISAGCNITRASKVNQVTRLAVTLVHLQSWFREVQQQLSPDNVTNT